jgi:hypothetical protein
VENPNNWIENQLNNTWEFEVNLKELGKTRKRVYNDGDIFILDLLSRTRPK